MRDIFLQILLLFVGLFVEVLAITLKESAQKFLLVFLGFLIIVVAVIWSVFELWPRTSGVELPGETTEETSGDVSNVARRELDELFGGENWFCFPDRTNGVGVRLLPENFRVNAPIRYIDTFQGRFFVNDSAPGATGATIELTENISAQDCPDWQKNALSSWVNTRVNSQQISSSAQLDELFGQGNWGCLPEYTIGVRVYYLKSSLAIQYPFLTVDVSDGSKHGVGEVVDPDGEVTVWFAGSLPGNQCP